MLDLLFRWEEVRKDVPPKTHKHKHSAKRVTASLVGLWLDANMGDDDANYEAGAVSHPQPAHRLTKEK